VSRWHAGVLLALLAAGCAAAPPRTVPRTQSAPGPTAEWVAAITAAARRAESESDLGMRAQLADEASRQAEACLSLEPQAAGCLYGHAVALGLEARAHPAHAGEWLAKMLTELAAAEAADPGYDEAGPARVRALVLIRAPGWPLGPGDPAAGIAAARRAVSLRPQYPPNLLALGEALAKSGDTQGARAAYQQAQQQALAAPAAPDRDEWLRESSRALQH
jgi:tetratricopeptide (TPR) repeat protein